MEDRGQRLRMRFELNVARNRVICIQKECIFNLSYRNEYIKFWLVASYQHIMNNKNRSESHLP